MAGADRVEHPLGLRNSRVQRLRRLVAKSSHRDAERRFVLEGAKLLDEALEAGAPLEGVYVTDGVSDPAVERATAAGVEVVRLAPGVAEQVADTVTPQPVLSVCRYVGFGLDTVVTRAGVVVVCVDVRDPGNAGTIMRSAEAAGAAGVVFCAGSVDVYNPKTVRASAGAFFHIPVVAGADAFDALDRLRSHGVRRLGTVANGGDRYTEVDMSRVALVFGNEAHGLPPAVEGHIDQWVTIPMIGRTESLNVGMAATVLCFEAARQRSASADAAGVRA